jgi:hypothetical protein
MARPKPEKVSFEEVLRLVDLLSPVEQDRLLEEMKLQWLRRALEEGEESLKRHGGLPAEEVFRQLQEKNVQCRQKGQQ